MSDVHAPKVIAGEEAVLARRYATALYDLAHEKKAVDAVAADLEALREGIEASPHFRIMATHPRLPMPEVQKAVKALISSVKFHDLTAAFLMQVVRGRRLAYLALIIDTFLANLAARRGEHVATVVTAKPLTEAQQTKLAAQLGKIVDGTVKIVVEEDADLIGGLVIKIGTRLIDASVQGRLARIERQLKSQQEAA